MNDEKEEEITMTYNKKEDIIKNLRDAGCDEEDIECFISEFCAGNKKIGEKRLREYRTELLDDLHEVQQRIDYLDYFLYKLNKSEINVDE